jgi:hypothetical protein
MVGRRSRTTPIAELALVAALAILASACTRSSHAEGSADTTAVQREPEPCVVSELLVPSCGAWLGASTPSADGRYDHVRGLAEYESFSENEPDILHFYQRGSEPFPTAEQRALAERAGKQRSILYFNWKPAPELTWRQIADGEADSSISSVAQGLTSYPHRMFLTIQHEPENDIIDQPDSGMTPTDYVAMYRHVAARLNELGVDNAVFVMGYMGFARWAPIVDALYPGDDVVDWIGYDPYGFSSVDTFEKLLNRPNDDGWPGFYRWATAKAPGTPIMLAEWGFDIARHPSAANALRDATQTLEQEFPMIKALVYWNSQGERVDARLGQGGELADRFADEYADFAGDLYFNSTSTDLAP